MCRNNLKVSFLNFCKWINKLSLTLFVHWNVGKYSDFILPIVHCFVNPSAQKYRNGHLNCFSILSEEVFFITWNYKTVYVYVFISERSDLPKNVIFLI